MNLHDTICNITHGVICDGDICSIICNNELIGFVLFILILLWIFIFENKLVRLFNKACNLLYNSDQR